MTNELLVAERTTGSARKALWASLLAKEVHALCLIRRLQAIDSVEHAIVIIPGNLVRKNLAFNIRRGGRGKVADPVCVIASGALRCLAAIISPFGRNAIADPVIRFESRGRSAKKRKNPIGASK